MLAIPVGRLGGALPFLAHLVYQTKLLRCRNITMKSKRTRALRAPIIKGVMCIASSHFLNWIN